MSNPSRRTLLAGLALPIAATGGLALPAVLPPAAAAEPHPDAALFAAEATYQEARAAWLASHEADRSARDAYIAGLGSCPSELEASEDEHSTLTHPFTPREVRCCRMFRWTRFSDVRLRDGGESHWRHAWTAAGLRVAIRYAVPIFDAGGRTPHRVRRWRSLLPAAEAYDARCEALAARYRVEELRATVGDADKAQIAAGVRFTRIPAKTIDGLALKVRHMDGFAWMGMGAPWIALLQSAAAVTGVKLRAPTFDCERWARELREAGGAIRWSDIDGDVRVTFPVDHRHTAEHKALLTRLSEEQRINREEIAFWLSQGGAA